MSFDTVGPLATEPFPTDVVTGDFNRDGRADAALGILRDTCYCGGVEAVLNMPGPTLEPRFGNGGFAPFHPAIGDFNRDGREDLAVTGVLDTPGSPPGWTEGVLILRGKADGSFEQKSLYPLDVDERTGHAAVAVGDFNRDGFQDLAVTSPEDDVVSVLLAAGRHTFRRPVEYPAGGEPGAIEALDLDRDGRKDLAVTDGATSAVSVLIGRRRGTFAPPVAYPVKNQPLSLVAGDFNEDGKRDLAVTSYYGGDVSVLLGARNGGLLPAQSYRVGPETHDLAVGDFNRDGHQDLAVTRSGFVNADEGVAILRGTGNGDFRHRVGVATDTYCCSRVDSAHFDRDGAPDLVVDYQNDRQPYGPGEVLLLLNAG